MKKVIPWVCLGLFSLSVSAGTLYRWVDADGKVHYTDSPPPATAKSVQQKAFRAGADAAGEDLPYALKMAASKFPVTLYVNDCGMLCDKAREHLARRGVPHSVKNPANAADAEALRKLAGQLEVPLLVVGTSVTKGYDAGEWDAALDAAGYPKANLLPKPAQNKPETVPAKPADVAPATLAKP